MLYVMANNWWAFLVRGALAILFGIAALVWPEITLTVLVLLFGAFAIVDGIVVIVAAFRDRRGINWALLLWGAVGVLIGIVALVWPEITAVALVWVIAAWAVVTGAIAIWSAIALRREIENEWLLGLSGLLSVAIGILFFVNPGAGALSLVWLIGIYAIVLGVLLVILAFRLRRFRDRVDRPSPVAG